jgi:ABC-2 type transport system permease protein
MSKVLTVAWREFRTTVMRKVFLLAVLGIPILIVGIMAMAIFIMAKHEEPPLEGTVAIVDPSGEVAEAAQIEFDRETIRREQERALQLATEEAARQMGSMPSSPVGAPAMAAGMGRGDVLISIEPVATDDAESIDALKRRVHDGDLLAVAMIPPEVIATPDPNTPRSERAKFQLTVGEEMDSDHVSLIEDRIGASVVRVRARHANLDPEQAMAMLRHPRSETSRTLDSGEASESEGMRVARQMIPMVFMMLIWIGVFTSAQHLMMTTIEEKSNRVMEVLLSAVSPLQLMTGKILGQGAVGLLIVLIYSSVGIASLVFLTLFTRFIHVMDLVYLATFYFMAYFMIASLMAAVGSAVSDIREANTLVTPVMMLVMIPLMLWMPIIQAPNGAIATACSFIPPAAPFAMILRLAAEESVQPWWQIPLSIAWGYICVVGMIWMAAKIFRVGVLMYGKPPSPLELLKWLRYS